MRKFLWLLLMVSPAALAQTNLYTLLRNAKTNQAIAGVSVFIKDSKQTAITDDS